MKFEVSLENIAQILIPLSIIVLIAFLFFRNRNIETYDNYPPNIKNMIDRAAQRESNRNNGQNNQQCGPNFAPTNQDNYRMNAGQQQQVGPSCNYPGYGAPYNGQMPPGQMPPGQNEPHKVNVTPQQKKMLEMMNYEDQQIFLNKIRLNQEKEKIEEEEQKKQILSEEKIKEIKGNAIEELKNSIKEPIIISSIAFIFSIPQINNLFLSTKSHMLVNDTGDITIVSLLIKALLVGITYYFIKKYNIV